MSTLTGDKLKKKICSLKLTRPLEELVVFDTHPQDFIVISDDLKTANMDPCQSPVKFFFWCPVGCFACSLSFEATVLAIMLDMFYTRSTWIKSNILVACVFNLGQR